MPTGKLDPEVNPEMTETTGLEVQLSVALGDVKVTAAVHWPGALLAVAFAGQVIAGGVTS